MKLFLLISSVLSVAFAQHQPSIYCNFKYVSEYTYTCELHIQNPDNFNNFTEIGGTHVDGYTNNHVTEVNCFDDNTDSTIVPSIICDAFPNIVHLRFVRTGVTGIDEIMLRNCSNVIELHFSSNKISSITSNAFMNLREVLSIDFSYNLITHLPEDLFSKLPNLLILNMRSIGLKKIPTDLFQPLTRLQYLDIGNNSLTELQAAVFRNITRLTYLYIGSNRLKTLNRKVFGDLNYLEGLELQHNAINALDREIFDEAPILKRILLNKNLCADVEFESFYLNRHVNIQELETCFSNFDDQIDTITTEGDADYQLFSAPDSGMSIRVRADGEIRIAFLRTNLLQTPMFEIFIGTANNTHSLFQYSLISDVITITQPTMNIITRDQWNDFVITWENKNILVFQGGVENSPFMNFTMQGLFPFNFYGLKSVETSAFWNLQPLR